MDSEAIKPGFEPQQLLSLAVWLLGKLVIFVSVSLSVKRIDRNIKWFNIYEVFRGLPGSLCYVIAWCYCHYYIYPKGIIHNEKLF